MALISVTRLRVRAPRYLPGFMLLALLSAWQAKRHPGNLGVGLLREANRTFWTRTAWRDEASMRAYTRAIPHRYAMLRLARWCDEASVVHWQQETPTLPEWPEAYRRMVAEGRRSRVEHPSPAHQAYDVPPPKL